MKEWFLAEPRKQQPPAIDQAKFRKLWNEEACLKERKASSHSKCSVCFHLDIEFDKLRGNNTEEAVRKRKLLATARAEHERNHLGERSEMDYACLRSVVEPHSIWLIMADAATAKNFELPRLQNARCKELQNVPWFGMKLMATYAPGFGFTPFLVHDSMFSGANLLWSVVWLTLCSMQEHYGYLPQELHLQLDNTSGENKNITMVAMASWLVQAGYFKRVRVFFLLVGHTHIVIDQVFGVITKNIKSQQLLEVQDLVAAIGASLLTNPQYQAKPVKVLPALWDFKAFVAQLGRLATVTYLTGNQQYYDAEGSWNGYHDFLFDDRGLSMRQSTRDAYLEPFKVLLEEPPADAWPEIAPNKPPDAWRKKNGKDVQSTIFKALAKAKFQNDHDRLQVAARWETHLKSIPADLPALKAANPWPLPRLSLNSIGIVTTGCATDQTDQTDELHEMLQEFGVKLCDRMMNPPVNPMVTSQQSATQLRAALERERRLLRGSSTPTVNQTTAVFPGDFALVAPDGNMGLELVHITKIEGSRSPTDPNVAFYANVYEQTQNEAHPGGLFGTFKEKLVQNAEGRQKTQRSKCLARFRRDQVRVFNVRPLGSGAKRRLNLATLRMVAEVDERPCYAIPDRIPQTHRHDDCHSDEEDDEEELDDDGPPAIRMASTRPNGRRAVGQTGKSDTSSEEDSSDEEQDEDQQSEMDCPDSEDSSEEEEDAEQRAQRERFEQCVAFALTAEEGQLVFVDLTGDAACSQHKYPCELAHISALSRGTDDDGKPTVNGTVRWYGRRFTTKGFPTKKKSQFGKYETNGTWATEHNFDLTYSMVPIKLPCALYPEKPPEQVSFDAVFMKEVAEKCEEFGVMHE